MDPESNPIAAAASEVKSAARNVLQALNGFDSTYVEELETQVQGLENQVNILSAKNYGLEVAVDHLEDKLKKAKQDCYDPDSPEAMAGEVSAPPTNNQGTVSGSGPF